MLMNKLQARTYSIKAYRKPQCILCSLFLELGLAFSLVEITNCLFDQAGVTANNMFVWSRKGYGTGEEGSVMKSSAYLHSKHPECIKDTHIHTI